MTQSDSAAGHVSSEKPIDLAVGENPPFPGALKIKSRDMAAKHQSTRTKARKAALDVLYEAELRGLTNSEVLQAYLAIDSSRVRSYTRQIIQGIDEYRTQIDQRIEQASQRDLGWMNVVDRNLARIAIWELDHTDLDAGIVISEAVGLADELSTDTSIGFLNGMLSKAAQSKS